VDEVRAAAIDSTRAPRLRADAMAEYPVSEDG
jgi:hypothetical protein